MMTVFLFYPNGYGVGLTGVYVAWMLVIAILYPYCRWVARVKAKRRDWWLSYLFIRLRDAHHCCGYRSSKPNELHRKESLRVVSMPKNIFFNCLLIPPFFASPRQGAGRRGRLRLLPFPLS